MKKLIIYGALVSAMLLGSCKKELDVVNPNQPTLEVFWKTQQDAERGVNAIYSTLHRGGISRWMPFYFIIRADEGRSQSPATEIVNNMDQFRITDYNFWGAYDVWRDNYVGIFRANQVLDNVPNIEMDVTLRNRLVGEAKFLRAMYYYHLVTLWGNVPLMLKTSTPQDKPSISSQTEVWAQIEKDLTEAAPSLPLQYTGADLGRATRGAAYALLARAHMQQREYTEALTPLQWLVTGEGRTVYDLMPDYRDNFLITTENNKESVFEWQFAFNRTENHDDDTDPRADNLNYGTSVAQFFAPPSIGWSDGEAHQWLVTEFLKENTATGERDPRLAASLLFDSTDVRGPDFTQIYGRTFTDRYGANNTDRVWFRKFLNDHWKNEEGYASPNNWRYIRYADVLLMYAEALNQTGNTTGAYPYVDRVRARAGLRPLSEVMPDMSPAAFLEQLKHERVTELAGEGHRWQDLLRWGDLGKPEVVRRDPAFSTFVTGRNEYLPIPQQEIDINPNLVQSDGWD
ncbi:MAG: RagB/SusD family nutrient uptake outer membrane protein [Cytophagales bacterium]|nr:RagB/SusD family nutrient uptake outer membrane protein [Cytophagales bacterium]